MIEIGDVFVFPLLARGPNGDQDLGAFGAARILARCEDAWFAGAMDTFASDLSQILVNASLLTLCSVPELPFRTGMLLFRGDDIPVDWRKVGQSELSPGEIELARLYMCWKDKSCPGFKSAAAYEHLGRVSEGLRGLSSGAAIEWRCRFERFEFLTSLNLTAQTRSGRTWDDVSAVKISADYPASLRRVLVSAYQQLLMASRDETLTPEALEFALGGFFKAAARNQFSAEYRDEIVGLALGVALARGGSEKATYVLAERYLS